MKWHREIDYHGSRSYAAEPPPVRAASLVFAWLMNIVRGKMRGIANGPSSSAVLFHDGERSFSLLGAADHGKSPASHFPTTRELDDDGERRFSRLRHEN